MKFISIDIETTGLDSENNQILSIGAIIEDTEKILPFNDIPKFHAAILHEQITGSLFAINLNRDLIDTISLYQSSNNLHERESIEDLTGLKFYTKDDIVESFYNFLYLNDIIPEGSTGSMQERSIKMVDGEMVPSITRLTKPTSITVAGKNFATFDKLFLEKLPRWKQVIRIKQRILDPAILFIDWKNDESLPSLGQCKERAGFNGIVSHNALEDAWDVIELLRKKY
jgi:DNA polymerase III epsilon subunit-like protein